MEEEDRADVEFSDSTKEDAKQLEGTNNITGVQIIANGAVGRVSGDIHEQGEGEEPKKLNEEQEDRKNDTELKQQLKLGNEAGHKLVLSQRRR